MKLKSTTYCTKFVGDWSFGLVGNSVESEVWKIGILDNLLHIKYTSTMFFSYIK